MASQNAYTASAGEIAELFQDYLNGDANRPALALSSTALPEGAVNALERTFESFGYESPACTYVTVSPADSDGEGGDVPLDPQALFLLVEALDPLYVVAADRAAATLLGAAFRTDYPADSPIRTFGRPAVSFADLPRMLETPEGKQKAWSLLKSLRS